MCNNIKHNVENSFFVYWYNNDKIVIKDILIEINNVRGENVDSKNNNFWNKQRRLL
jgi:hypothetical protein